METLDKEYKKNDPVLRAIKVAIAEKAISDGIIETGFDLISLNLAVMER